mgnify:CR=1 FL=1
MRGYWGDGKIQPREPQPDGKDYEHDRVLRDVKEVLEIYQQFLREAELENQFFDTLNYVCLRFQQ